jgi:hypothetical protein
MSNFDNYFFCLIYTSTKIVSSVNFYFNNLELLEQFIRYFKWIAADLIGSVDEHRWIPSLKSTLGLVYLTDLDQYT